MGRMKRSWTLGDIGGKTKKQGPVQSYDWEPMSSSQEPSSKSRWSQPCRGGWVRFLNKPPSHRKLTLRLTIPMSSLSFRYTALTVQYSQYPLTNQWHYIKSNTHHFLNTCECNCLRYLHVLPLSNGHFSNAKVLPILGHCGWEGLSHLPKAIHFKRI